MHKYDHLRHFCLISIKQALRYQYSIIQEDDTEHMNDDHNSFPSNTDEAYVDVDIHHQESPQSPLDLRPMTSMETLNIEDTTNQTHSKSKGCCQCFFSLCRRRQKVVITKVEEV